MLKQLLFYLKVSRPGLWFATIWLYLLPTSRSLELLESPAFWLGLLYVCFPINFLVYGWNDVVDYETDALNPRKDSFWFGARGSKAQLQLLWKPLLVVQLATIPLVVYAAGWQVLWVFAGFFAVNWAYNFPGRGLRGTPPFELFCQAGYLLIVPLSMMVNDTAALPWQTYAYLFLFSVQSHLMGEVMDIEPDSEAGRQTTATLLGMQRTKLLIMSLVVAEVLLLFYAFNEWIFGGILAIGLVWLLLDLLVVFRGKTYTVQQMRQFALLSNVMGISTIAYVWWSGCLLTIG